jgi:cell wall-associated NlpC family hydrolase
MRSATLRARLGVTAATLIAGFGLTVIPAFASTANATPTRAAADSRPMSFDVGAAKAPRHRRNTHHIRVMHKHDKKVREVLHEARRQRGKPYSYGAAGPGAFDCSGLVMYVFQHAVGRSLPHNAAQQYHSLHHVRRQHLRKGDLIFTDNGYISHVGIFAGHHHWWVAPHTGTHVQLQRIYSAHFVYARVLVMNHHKH